MRLCRVSYWLPVSRLPQLRPERDRRLAIAAGQGFVWASPTSKPDTFLGSTSAPELVFCKSVLNVSVRSRPAFLAAYSARSAAWARDPASIA